MDSLRAKSYEATIGRFVLHDYGLASMVEHPGDRYRVAFAVAVERRFVIRAPAGTYSFQRISQIIPGPLGEQLGACRVEGIANFEIRAGTTIYVGRLSIVAGLASDSGGGTLLARAKRNLASSGLPEAALEMRVSAIDVKESSLRALGLESDRAMEVGTELMNVVERRENWNCMRF